VPYDECISHTSCSWLGLILAAFPGLRAIKVCSRNGADTDTAATRKRLVPGRVEALATVRRADACIEAIRYRLGCRQIGLSPDALVGEVMAHQGARANRSVKSRPRWHRMLTARPSGGAVLVLCTGGNSEQQRRPLDPSRPSWYGCEACLSRGAQQSSCAMEATPERLRRVRECTVCYHPMRLVLLSGSAGQVGVLEVPSGRFHRVQEMRRLWLSEAVSPSLGGTWLNRRLEATPVRSRRVRNHACRGA